MRIKGTAGLVVGVFGLVVVGAGVLAQGCGGGSSAKCDVGSESCPCTSGGICNSGLMCLSKVCVNPSGTAGTGGGGSTGTAGSTGSVDTACASFDAICQKLNTCAPALVKFDYGTVDECVKRFKISCLDASKAPDSGLTAATISACAAALPAATCEDAIYRKVTACEVKGGRSNGMACGTNEQCSTGHCAQADQACGVCAAFVGAGAACTADEDCEPGLLCSNDSHCVVPGTAGGVCNDNQPCRLGLYCRNGSCVNGAETPGATCEPTLAASCDLLKGIYCDSTVGKCANLGFATNGDPCGVVSAKFVSCAAGTCIYPTVDATAGVCGALAGDGAACNATTLCESPGRCLSGHCKLPSSSACL